VSNIFAKTHRYAVFSAPVFSRRFYVFLFDVRSCSLAQITGLRPALRRTISEIQLGKNLE